MRLIRRREMGTNLERRRTLVSGNLQPVTGSIVEGWPLYFTAATKSWSGWIKGGAMKILDQPSAAEWAEAREAHQALVQKKAGDVKFTFSLGTLGWLAIIGLAVLVFAMFHRHEANHPPQQNHGAPAEP